MQPEDLGSYKVGAFVQVFGKDSYAMSYLFGYKLSEAKEIYQIVFDKKLCMNIK